jgi:uncharacterized SAM-binding protein YcdF (DUF218 family)
MVLCSCDIVSNETTICKSDAIVILAGNYQERVPVAVQLYRDGYAPKIILTNDGDGAGWSTKYNRTYTMIEWAEEKLLTLGVSRSNIIKLPFYKSGTVFDAISVKEYIVPRKISSLIVVTSDYHSRRSLLIFRKVLGSNVKNIHIYSAKSIDNNTFYRYTEYFKLVYYIIRYNVLGLLPKY